MTTTPASETPRTDALEELWRKGRGPDVNIWEHARILELALREAEEQRDKSLSANRLLQRDNDLFLSENTRLVRDLETGFMQGAYARLQNLQRAEQEAAQLREQLRAARACIRDADILECQAMFESQQPAWRKKHAVAIAAAGEQG